MASACCARASHCAVIAPRQLSKNVVESSTGSAPHNSGGLQLGSSLTPNLTRCWKRGFPAELKLHRGSKAAVAAFKSGEPQKIQSKIVIPDPDYRIPVVLIGAAGINVYGDNLAAAVPLGILGFFLLFQASRVKFVFEDEDLEVKIGDELKESGENAFVGGKNRWKFSSFVNWEFWWPSFPVLVYFKETQTKPEGQIHFFPILFNGKQLYDVMVERAGPSKTSGPK
eukprot:TRINITY_DN21417_c0_g1_i1.p1 TRINITY_DN21417_c0_g1~~TRINITY_DN21417_c0_g1_i1.p1  ORF type:complete len:226 (+),score=34.77 TRINITY_DN21417_c0_g1_i1:188-865(+)